MPREIKTTTVDGREYRVMQVGVKTGRQILARALRAVPAMLLGGGFDLSSLNTDDFDFICDSMLADAKVGMVDTKGEGKVTVVDLAGQLDHCFAGKPASYLQLVLFAWEANNFNEVFREVGAAIVRRARPSTSGSPTEATGTSGDSSSPPA